MKATKMVCTFLLTACFAFLLTPKANALPASQYQRIMGADRYQTAIALSRDAWTYSYNAVLCTGEDFPDALCAAPLAEYLNAPILLTGKNTLSDGVLNRLVELQTKNVYIIGGPGVISYDVENTIKSKGISCIRIYGEDRYQTSVKIAKYIPGNENMEIVVATGENFPDALSIAPIAGIKGMPIILTPKESINDDIRSYINERKINKSYIIGGPGVISEIVESQLPNPERISGTDRYGTNVAVLDRFADILNYSTIYLATGENFPDALAGSAAASISSSPIMLVTNYSKEAARNYFMKKVDLINRVLVLGGKRVVPTTLVINITADDGPVINTLPGDDYINNIRGNAPGNVSNGAYAAQEDEWVYFPLPEEPVEDEYGYVWFYHNLYKCRLDGSNMQKVSDYKNGGGHSFHDIYVQNGWIYYRNSNPGDIVKMKIDGTERTVFENIIANQIVVVGDWIYYTETDANHGGLYKVRTDGTDNKRLASMDSMYDINVEGDFIYFITDDGVYRIGTDDSNMLKIINSRPDQIIPDDGWVYYIEDYKLYKIKNDGTSNIPLIPDTDIWCINLWGDWIYFSNDLRYPDEYQIINDIGMIKKDGTEKSIIWTGKALRINIAGDMIFIIADYDCANGDIITKYGRKVR